MGRGEVYEHVMMWWWCWGMKWFWKVDWRKRETCSAEREGEREILRGEWGAGEVMG